MNRGAPLPADALLRELPYVGVVLLLAAMLASAAFGPAREPTTVPPAADVALPPAALGLAAMAGAGGLAALAVAAVRLARRMPLLPGKPAPRAAWGVWTPIKLLAVYAVAPNVVAAFFAGAAPESRRLAFLLAQAASAVLLFALAWRILCIEGHVPARDVGLTLRDAGREAGLGLAACLAYLPLYALVVLAQSWALTRAGAPLPEQQAVRLLRDGGDLRVVAVLAAQAILLAPAVEELVFRALLMPALERWMRPGFAAAASSAAFSACHSDAVVVTPIFVLGCVLGYVYLRRRSLVTAVACHAAHNALFVVAILMTRFATGPRP